MLLYLRFVSWALIPRHYHTLRAHVLILDFGISYTGGDLCSHGPKNGAISIKAISNSLVLISVIFIITKKLIVYTSSSTDGNMNHVFNKWAPLEICVFLMFWSFPVKVTRASSQNSFLNKISQISRPPNLGEDTLPGRLLSFLPPSNPCLFNAFDVRGSNRNSPDQIFPFFSKYFLFFPVSKYLPLFPSLLFSFSR